MLLGYIVANIKNMIFWKSASKKSKVVYPKTPRLFPAMTIGLIASITSKFQRGYHMLGSFLHLLTSELSVLSRCHFRGWSFCTKSMGVSHSNPTRGQLMLNGSTVFTFLFTSFVFTLLLFVLNSTIGSMRSSSIFLACEAVSGWDQGFDLFEDKSPSAFLKMTYPNILVPKFSWHIQLFIHVWHL